MLRPNAARYQGRDGRARGPHCDRRRAPDALQQLSAPPPPPGPLLEV